VSTWRDLMARDFTEPTLYPKSPQSPKPEPRSNIGDIGDIGYTPTGAKTQRDQQPETDPQALADPAQERRRLTALEMLRRHPEITRAVVVDGDADPVRVALAIRNVGTCELLIPRDRWDPFRFLELLDKHGGTA
jgi:hypothetical protein